MKLMPSRAAIVNRQRPTDQPTRECDRDGHHHAAVQLRYVIDCRPVQPQPDRRSRQRAERQKIAPRERDGSVPPALVPGRPSVAKRDDVVQDPSRRCS